MNILLVISVAIGLSIFYWMGYEAGESSLREKLSIEIGKLSDELSRLYKNLNRLTRENDRYREANRQRLIEATKCNPVVPREVLKKLDNSQKGLCLEFYNWMDNYKIKNSPRKINLTDIPDGIEVMDYIMDIMWSEFIEERYCE